jgi:FKBP-type peptidyl-prolyl cis-trans isomerase
MFTQVGTGRVIKGWDAVVLDMPVGAKRDVVIPAHMGYGARGAGGVIPGNATLYFRMELIEVVPTQPSIFSKFLEIFDKLK